MDRIQEIKKFFFAIDNDQRLEQLHKNGAPYWLLFRWKLFWQLVQLDLPSVVTVSGKRKSTIRNRLQFYKMFFKNLSEYRKLKKLAKESNLIVCGEKAFINENATVYNRNFYFLKLLPRTNSVFLFVNPDRERLKKYHIPAYDFNSFLGVVTFYARFHSLILRLLKHKRFLRVRSEINAICQDHAGKYASEISRALPMQRELIATYSQFKIASWLSRKFLESVKPRTIFIEDGNYGSLPQIALVAQANLLGIQTAELQHGVFDIAFQYGDRLNGTNFLNLYKTKNLFTLGKHHSNYSNLHNNKVEIGNYYLSVVANDSRIGTSRTHPRVLLIDGKQNSYPMLQIANNVLAKDLLGGKFEFAIKLHPYNSTTLEDLHMDSPRLQVYRDEEVFHLIKQHDIIVSSYSTAIFETLPFHKHLLVFDDELSREFIPSAVGKRFSDERSFVNRLMECIQASSDYQDISYYFAAFDLSKIADFVNDSNESHRQNQPCIDSQYKSQSA